MASSVPAIQQLRRAKGLCPRCGKTPKPEHVLCETCHTSHVETQRRYRTRHREQRRQDSRDRYIARKLAGVCVECQRPRDSQRTRCSDCRQRCNEAKQRWTDLIRKPLCTKCGKTRVNLWPLEVQCSQCRSSYVSRS